MAKRAKKVSSEKMVVSKVADNLANGAPYEFHRAAVMCSLFMFQSLENQMSNLRFQSDDQARKLLNTVSDGYPAFLRLLEENFKFLSDADKKDASKKAKDTLVYFQGWDDRFSTMRHGVFLDVYNAILAIANHNQRKQRNRAPSPEEKQFLAIKNDIGNPSTFGRFRNKLSEKGLEFSDSTYHKLWKKYYSG